MSGTPEYIPPELLMNKIKSSLPHSTDVWSMGVIILEILTGIPVWMNFKCRVIKNNKTLFK